MDSLNGIFKTLTTMTIWPGVFPFLQQISLADLRTAALVGVIQRLPFSAHLITPETAPGLVKVKEVVDSHPSIVQWRETPLFKSLRLSSSFPSRPRPDGIKLNDRNGNKSGGLDAANVHK